jgi:hypothetical protein
MIELDEVRTKRKGDVAFASYALPKFPAVRRVADPFGRGKVPDDDLFYETLERSPKWIPFVDLVGGHYLAFDLLPGPKGASGQIILFGRDVQRVRRVAPDAKAFVEQCLAFDGNTAPLAGIFTELEL